MNCAACCCTTDDKEEQLRCTIDSCNKIYHLLCAGGKTLTEPRITWICPECRCATKKGGDNSLTPVDSAKKHREFNDSNITYRKRVNFPCTADESYSINPSIESSAEDVHSLRQEMQLLKDQISHAVSLIVNYESKMVGYAAEVRELNKKLEAVVVVAAATAATSAPTSQPPLCTNPDYQANIAEAAPPQLNMTAAMVTQASIQSQTNETVTVAAPESQPQLDTAAAALGVLTTPAPNRRNQKKAKTKHNSRKLPLRELLAKKSQSEHSEAASEVCVETGTTVISSQQVQEDPWSEVKIKRSLRPASLCGTAGPAITTLKAVEPRKYIHLWNMESNADDIRDYLRQLCTKGTCTVQELTPRGDYKSYKIGVPTAAYDMLLSTEVWPVNARIKAWIPYQRPAVLADIGGTSRTTAAARKHLPFRNFTRA